MGVRSRAGQRATQTNVHSAATFEHFGSLRGMKRVAISTISVLLLLLLAAVSASAASGRQKALAKCQPGHSRLLAVDAQAQVYKMINEGGPFLEAYGCVYGRRPYILGRLPENSLSPGGAGGVELITLSGTMVAYQYSAFGEVGWKSWIIAVQSLRTGKYLHKLPTGKLEEPSPNPESAGIGPALTIVIKSDGAVAWIAEDRELSENGPPYYQVHALDKTGSRILAAGTGIDPRSLALAGSTLYWTKGGQPFSTMLE